MLTLVALLSGCSGSETPASTRSPPPFAALPEAAADGRVVARVGPGFVTEGEFSTAAARTAHVGEQLGDVERRQILDKLVTEEVLFQEALLRGLHRDPKVRKIMVNLLLREEIYADIRASDIAPEELESYYAAHKDEFVVPEKVQVKRIFVRFGSTGSATDPGASRTQDEAKALVQDIRRQILADPSSFKQLAEQHSDDPYKRRGGDIGYLSREGKPGLPQEVVDLAFSLSLGQLSEPFLAGDGYNLVVVAARREAVERTFEQMKGSVLRRLKNDKFQRLTEEYIQGAQARYEVDVDEAVLRSAKIEARPAGPADPEGALGEGDEHDGPTDEGEE